jgi:hypothetical protein
MLIKFQINYYRKDIAEFVIAKFAVRNAVIQKNS